MQRRSDLRIAVMIAAVVLATLGVTLLQAQQATEGANAVLPWAFVLNDPPPADGAEAPDPDEVVTSALAAEIEQPLWVVGEVVEGAGIDVTNE